MDEIYYKKQVKKLLQQIGTLQSIDSEKHKCFSKKAIDVFEKIPNGDYMPLLDLEAEIIDFLVDKVKTNQIENLPIPVQKSSLINRIRGWFSRESRESEISKLAEQLITDSETQKGQFIPDKRTVVYDFFKNNISSNDRIQGWGTKQTIQYTNSEGHERTFDIGIDQDGIGEIEIGESKIGTYRKSVGDDVMSYGVRNAITEYLRLIKYDQFINSKTGDKTFINELGKEIERASNGYDPQNTNEFFKAGKRLDKALMKNPVYMQIKTSFDRAYEEYQKTFNEFRQSESNRRDRFNKENLFLKELKVEGVSTEIGIETAKEHDKIKEDKEHGDD